MMPLSLSCSSSSTATLSNDDSPPSSSSSSGYESIHPALDTMDADDSIEPTSVPTISSIFIKTLPDKHNQGIPQVRHFARRLLPSTHLKQWLPAKVYRIACYISFLFWFIIGLLVLRKTERATLAVRYIKTHGHTVSLRSLEESSEFRDLVTMLGTDSSASPPAILLLNQHALNMTFNFLCNTKIFPGAHERFVFVTLDATARDVLNEHWPAIRQFYWPTPSLYVRNFVLSFFLLFFVLF